MLREKSVILYNKIAKIKSHVYTSNIFLKKFIKKFGGGGWQAITPQVKLYLCPWFPYTHISTLKLQNCENHCWLIVILLYSFNSQGKTWLVAFEFDWVLLYCVQGPQSDWFFLVNKRGYGQICFNWLACFLHNLRNEIA